VITALVQEGPAAVAGLKVGDTILKLNGNPLGREDFNSQISSYKFGTKVAVTYLRGSWASIVIVTVGVETL
jgi:S1-C subfamily serine protease